MRYFSPRRLDILVGLLIAFVIMILLILPVAAMYRLSSFRTGRSSAACLGVLVVFTLIFSSAISVLTKARRHEIFAASAA